MDVTCISNKSGFHSQRVQNGVLLMFGATLRLEACACPDLLFEAVKAQNETQKKLAKSTKQRPMGPQ